LSRNKTLLPEGQIPEKNLSHGSQLEEAGVKPTAAVIGQQEAVLLTHRVSRLQGEGQDKQDLSKEKKKKILLVSLPSPNS